MAELAAHGYTQPQIAAACSCSQSTVSDLANGHTTEPRYALGAALQDLLEKAKAEKAAG